MGRPKTLEDQEILNCARDIFRREGHAASTRDVARSAGISQAVLYQRFGSKEELFFRAMAPEQADLEGMLGVYRPRNARHDLDRIAERLVERLAELLPVLLHVLAHPHAVRHRLLALHQERAFRPLLAALTERFRRLQADRLVTGKDPSAAAWTFLAVAHASALARLVSHETSPGGGARALQGLLGVLWQGLAPSSVRRTRRSGRAKRRT